MALFTTMLIFFLAISAVIIYLQGEKIISLEAELEELFKEAMEQVEENWELSKENILLRAEVDFKRLKQNEPKQTP